MSASEYTPEVFSLSERIAAAFMRGDAEYSRELINEARKRWETEGRYQQQRDAEKKHDLDLEFYRRAEVYFETKDGLRVLGSIESRHGWPHVWKRACRRAYDEVRFNAGANYESIEVRNYELQSERAKDGRPVYLET